MRTVRRLIGWGATVVALILVTSFMINGENGPVDVVSGWHAFIFLQSGIAFGIAYSLVFIGILIASIFNGVPPIRHFGAILLSAGLATTLISMIALVSGPDCADPGMIKCAQSIAANSNSVQEQQLTTPAKIFKFVLIELIKLFPIYK